MNPETLLYRQINPNWIQGGRLTSQVFSPTPKDDKKISVYDGNQIDAEGSYLHYTSELKLKSDGVCAVTCEECSNEDLPSYVDGDPFPEHAVIDFSSIESNSSIKKKAKRLTSKAAGRGILHP